MLGTSHVVDCHAQSVGDWCCVERKGRMWERSFDGQQGTDEYPVIHPCQCPFQSRLVSLPDRLDWTGIVAQDGKMDKIVDYLLPIFSVFSTFLAVLPIRWIFDII